MLIVWYSIQKSKKPNNDSLKESEHNIAYSWLNFPTTLENPLVSYTPNELIRMFNAQLKKMEEELSIHKSYNMITKIAEADTRKQYDKFFFYEWYAYVKQALLKESGERNLRESATIHEPTLSEEQVNLTPIYKKQDEKVVGISVNSIRAITNFTYYPIPAWSETNTPVYIKWQQDMIEDMSDILVIDGSRQMGKSFWMAELLIEESFVPWADILVAAFLQKTTNVILRYIETLSYWFDEGTFEVHSKDWFIQNTITWVRIHFRTLADDAKNVLGLTLRLVVVDEAQEVTKSIYDDALKPTLTTTGWRIVLIWTAIEDTSSYMYHMITEYHKGTNYNNPWQKTLRYIRVSANENPLIHPKERREIMQNKDAPATLRQYFNRWWKQSDASFNLKFVKQTEMDEPSRAWHIIIAYDPARNHDRSAYVVAHAYNNKLTILASWEVKENLKKDWTLQASFHKSILEPYKEHYKSLSTGIDLTWVGDWVCTIFRQCWLNINQTVRYTSWTVDREVIPDSFNVPKHILINNALDMIETWTVEAIAEFNDKLKEEFSYCSTEESSAWILKLKSNFYDDIINAFMIACYIARKKRYLYRVDVSKSSNPFKEEMNMYNKKTWAEMHMQKSQSYF